VHSVKYIGMDVHKDTISIAALNSSGKRVIECHRNQSQHHSAVFSAL
jgi:hypothetical protein